MPTVLLVRHGRTTANAGGVLAGWTPGISLDDAGTEQARALGMRMAGLPLAAVVASPLQRCVETAGRILAEREEAGRPAVETDDRLGECRYGDWTGEELKKLAKDPLWPVVQAHPTGMQFPGGESLRQVQFRAVEAVRDRDARLRADGGEDAVWMAVSHGDVIKAIAADALGMHLDAFQRLVVDPCSVTVVRYTAQRPFVLRLNDVGGDLTGLKPPPAKKGRRRGRSVAGDAAVGGGTGTADHTGGR